MFGKLFGAFLLGVALAGGLGWYLNRPVAPPPAPPAVAVVAVPAPAPAPVPEPVTAPVPAAVPKPAPKPRTSFAVAKPQAPQEASKPALAATAEPAPEPEKPRELPIPMQKVDVPPPQVTVAAKEEAPPAPRQPRTATIPAGTLITVRLNETLASNRNEEGYTFRATLDAPLVVDGMVLAERGTQQAGRIVGVEKAGRAKGHAKLALELTELSTADGQKVEIKTDTFQRLGTTEGKKTTATRAGIGAGIGAAIGAMAGGGIGAAIGAAAGAGAGAGTVLVTKGQEAELHSETRISFRLKEPVTLTEKL
jgi:hypothetical protein